MKNVYDEYYQTESLFGEAYPELIRFFTDYPERGKLLDLGCGQGRDAIPLARLGYTVTGIDNSQVGIDQMNQQAQAEGLPLEGLVGDLYAFTDFAPYAFILMDSMFHFGKRERQQETAFLQGLINKATTGTLICICIQASGQKVQILHDTIAAAGEPERVFETDLKYTFHDQESGHQSTTQYKMIVLRK